MDKERSIKHTHQTKDQVTRTPLKTGGELRCSGRVGSSWNVCDRSVYLYNLYFFYYIFITPVHNLPLMARQLGIICFTPVNNLPLILHVLSFITLCSTWIRYQKKNHILVTEVYNKKLSSCLALRGKLFRGVIKQLSSCRDIRGNLFSCVIKKIFSCLTIWFFFWYRIHVEQRVINDNTCSISTDIL
jgi:hypothetical protein